MSQLLEKVLFVAAVSLAAPLFAPSVALADGCYQCGGDSTSDACKNNYCRYRENTFAARKECEKRGCKISGTGPCPATDNYKVCTAPTTPTGTTVAAIPWCAPAPPRG